MAEVRHRHGTPQKSSPLSNTYFVVVQDYQRSPYDHIHTPTLDLHGQREHNPICCTECHALISMYCSLRFRTSGALFSNKCELFPINPLVWELPLVRAPAESNFQLVGPWL